jgi:hypothetical protein
MEAPACTPPVPFDASDELTVEIAASELPDLVIQAFASVAERNLSPDHSFLLAYSLLESYLLHHVEQCQELGEELLNPNLTSELTAEQVEDTVNGLVAWSADRERIMAAMDILSDLADAANDLGGEGEEEPG